MTFSSFYVHLQGAKKGLLERLKDGVVVGDGSFVVTLERRGYVEAGAWTPEAVVQYPDAGRFSVFHVLIVLIGENYFS